jgi:hypothetical protein
MNELLTTINNTLLQVAGSDSSGLLMITAFGLGLVGSTHCLGMCGGIVSALSLSIDKPSALSRAGYITLFNLGRTASYAVAGALIGVIGQLLGDYHNNVALAMRITSGALLILMGLYLAGWSQLLTKLEKQGQWLWRRLQPLSKSLLPVKTAPQSLALGMLWGWLPCGLVYSTLVWSSTQGNWQLSALLMASFGLGTLPAMFATGIAANQTKLVLQKKRVRNTMGILVILFGVWTIVSIFPHMGHGNHGAHDSHQQMDHSEMNHEDINHEGMDHEGMDHESMDHESMDHESMDH